MEFPPEISVLVEENDSVRLLIPEEGIDELFDELPQLMAYLSRNPQWEGAKITMVDHDGMALAVAHVPSESRAGQSKGEETFQSDSSRHILSFWHATSKG